MSLRRNARTVLSGQGELWYVSYFMFTLIVVPARSGSKRLPGKNLMSIGGISLVGRAVITGEKFARLITDESAVLVDTDSEVIALEARRYGGETPFLRPAELARATTSTADSVLHAVNRFETLRDVRVNSIVLLQPTSPLRMVEDVMQCWHARQRAGRSSSLTVVASRGHGQPLTMAADGTLELELPGASGGRKVVANGSAYVIDRGVLERERSFFTAGETVGHLMPAERSVDVDTLQDFALAQSLLEHASEQRTAL